LALSNCGWSVRQRLSTLSSVELSGVNEDNSDTDSDINTVDNTGNDDRSTVTDMTAAAATSAAED